MIGAILLAVWGALWALAAECAIRGGTWRDGLRRYWPHMVISAAVYGVANSISSMRAVPAWVASLALILLVAWCWMTMREAWVGCTRLRESLLLTALTIPAGSLASGLAMRTGNGNVLPGWFWLAMGVLFWSVMVARSVFRAPGRARNIASAIAAGIPALVAAICTAVMLFNMIGGAVGNAREAAAMRRAAEAAAQTEAQGESDTAAGADEAAESGGIGSWVAAHNPFAGLLGGNSESDNKAAEPDGEDTAQTPDGVAVQNADADATSPYNNGAAGTPSVADAAAEPAPAPVTSAVPSDADLGLGGADGLKVEAPEWVHFYNLDLDSDGIEGLNFGPNPYTSDSITVDGLDREFRTRAYCDVNFGTAVMAYCDSIFGTRYLGVFYSAAKEDWPTAINAARDTFMNDSELYRETLKQFFRYLNAASVTKRWVPAKSLTDMMYQNPFTITGVPDIIVLDSDIQEDSLVLTYSRPIKGGSRVDANFRVGCGFQPTNVAAVMNITPTTRTAVYTAAGKSTPVAKTSTPAPATGSAKPAASSSGSGSKPSPSSSSSGSGAKDPSKGTNAGANKSGSGSGRSTNSGTGSRTSTADKPTNTTSGQTSKPAARANQPANSGGQKTGNDSAATPSTAVPRAAVQNNGETGNARDGSAPIRTETPVAAPATTGGAPIANSGSGGANGHADLPED